MENKAIVKLFKYRLKKSDLDQLSDDQSSALAVFCFAVNEINCLMRLYILSEQSLNTDQEIVAATAIQRNLLVRTLSSKLFELRDFLCFQTKYNKTKDISLLNFRTIAQNKLKPLESHNGFEFAKDIRNEAAFHYKLKPIRERKKWVHDTAIHSMYFHENGPNSFFPFGEEVLFIGLINEKITSTESEVSAKKLIEDWADWGAKSIETMNKLFEEFFFSILHSGIPERKATEQIYYVDPKMVGEIETAKIPVFLRISK